MNKNILLTLLSVTILTTGCAGSSSSSTTVEGSSIDGSPISPSVDTGGDPCVDRSSSSTQIRRLREEICEATNLARAKAGRAPLRLDNSRSLVAEGHALDMSSNNFFSHVSPTRGTLSVRLRRGSVSYKTAGENIARNTVVNSGMIMNQWMTSPGHRANILNKAYGRLGIGISNGRWVQVFTN